MTKHSKKIAKSTEPIDEIYQGDLIELARTDFLAFIFVTFGILHPTTEFRHARYIDLIVEYLDMLPDLKTRRLIFNLPPGYMKSTIVSVLYTAWKLGTDPTLRFICISYGDDLAHELSERTRKVMVSKLYKRIFPNTVLEKKAQDHLKTTKGGARYATAVMSDITGFRADIIIVDDPLQPKHANSEREKASLQKWFYDSVLTRFVDPKLGSVILVMHRLAPNDISGVFEQVGWKVVKLPLVAEESSEYIVGKFVYKRNGGDLLNPALAKHEDVEGLKKELPPYVWETQYQQRPSLSESGLFDISRVSRYDKLPKLELVIHSWDIGGTLNGNYSVCTKFGLFKAQDDRDCLCVIEVLRLKRLLPDVEATIEMLINQDKPAFVAIDGNGIGLGPAQSLQRKYGTTRIKTATGDNATKIERFGAAMTYTYGKRILLPEKAPWMETWLFEMVGFPDGGYDDQVDSFTQIVARFEQIIFWARLSASRQ